MTRMYNRGNENIGINYMMLFFASIPDRRVLTFSCHEGSVNYETIQM